MSDRTIDDENMDSASVEGSTWSINSFGDISRFIKAEDGRVYNTLNELYFFPTDSPEWNRMDKDHTIAYLTLGGLYPCPQVVREVLKPSPGVSKDILDLGCGTGLWAMEMAREFGHANVIGVDLVPIPLDTTTVPQNVRMEVDDINLGLPHFHGRFDLVHLRNITTGILDYEATLKEAEKCLKPGGILIAIEMDVDLLAEDQKSFLPMANDDNPDASWLRRVIYEAGCCMRHIGGGSYLKDAILDEGFWHSEELDPATCGAASMYAPVGPWPISLDFDHNNRLKFCGALVRQSMLDIHQSLYIPMKKANISQEIISDWSKRVDEELTQTKHKSWARLRMAWGRKRLAEGLPAPSLGIPEIYIPADAQRRVVVDSRIQRSLAIVREPSQVEVYSSKEELKKRVAVLEAVRGPFPSPLVLKFNGIPS